MRHVIPNDVRNLLVRFERQIPRRGLGMTTGAFDV